MIDHARPRQIRRIAKIDVGIAVPVMPKRTIISWDRFSERARKGSSVVGFKKLCVRLAKLPLFCELVRLPA
jgi:hypothetical protein